jgi:hypothetical protein
MNSVSKSFKNIVTKLMVLIFISGFLLNCSENDNITSDPVTSYKEEAEAIASNISSETNGAVDQLSYLSDLASNDGMSSLSKIVSNLNKSNTETISSIDTVYDASAGKWTISIVRERNVPQRNLISNYSHVFTLQYLKNGIPQKYFITNNDTANSIRFDIIEGFGTLQSNRIQQDLELTSGSWQATVTANNSLIVSGNYSRSANAIFTNVNATRSYDYSVSMSFAGVSIPINKGDEIWLYLSGTMSGQFIGEYSATVNGQQNNKSINKTFAIAFSKKSVFGITIESEDYSSDIESGEIQ